MKIPFLSLFSRKTPSRPIITNGYEAVRVTETRPRVKSGPPADAADKLPEWTHKDLVENCRYAADNFGVAKEIITSMQIYAIGDGMRAQPRSKSPEWNDAAREVWKTFERNADVSKRKHRFNFNNEKKSKIMSTEKSIVIGKSVKWSMVELSDVMIQSADLSIKHSEKLVKGIQEATESAIIYDTVGGFSINAVLLEDTDLNAIEATIKEWCETEATETGGLAAGGSVIITEKKISQKIEDAQTVDISAKYLPYCPAKD